MKNNLIVLRWPCCHNARRFTLPSILPSRSRQSRLYHHPAGRFPNPNSPPSSSERRTPESECKKITHSKVPTDSARQANSLGASVPWNFHPRGGNTTEKDIGGSHLKTRVPIFRPANESPAKDQWSHLKIAKEPIDRQPTDRIPASPRNRSFHSPKKA